MNNCNIMINHVIMNNCWRTLPEDLIGEIIIYYADNYKNMYKLSLCCKKFSKKFNFTLYKTFLNIFAKRFGSISTLEVFES